MRSLLVAALCVSLCRSAIAQSAGTAPPPEAGAASQQPPTQTYAPPPQGGSYGPPPYAYSPYGPPPPAYGRPPPGWGPPPEDPHAHRHDGFYLRMGIGTGYGQAKTTGGLAGTDVTAHYSGVGPAFELLIGGTVGSGFVIGGGFVGQDIWDPKITIDSNDPTFPSTLNVTGALGVGALGPFIDWFPDDTGGAHIGAMIGLGLIGLRDDRGFGGSVWTGYDFWIANQWSFGVEGRAALASGQRDIDLPTSTGFNSIHFDDTASSFELLFTALLH